MRPLHQGCSNDLVLFKTALIRPVSGSAVWGEQASFLHSIGALKQVPFSNYL